MKYAIAALFIGAATATVSVIDPPDIVTSPTYTRYLSLPVQPTVSDETISQPIFTILPISDSPTSGSSVQTPPSQTSSGPDTSSGTPEPSATQSVDSSSAPSGTDSTGAPPSTASTGNVSKTSPTSAAAPTAAVNLAAGVAAAIGFAAAL